MKKLLIILGLFLVFACEDKHLCECIVFYNPMMSTPQTFIIESADFAYWNHKTGTYIDELGNKFAFEIICKE